LEKPEKLPLGGYFQKIKDQRSEKKKADLLQQIRLSVLW
jgi:hypothetical protein